MMEREAKARDRERMGEKGRKEEMEKMETMVPRDETGETGEAGCHCGGEHTAHGYVSDKKRYQTRLKRIEGQVRGVQRMIEGEEYCIDVLTQISALQSALKSVALNLLDDHMAHCVVDAAKAGGEEAEEKLREVSAAIARLSR